MSKLLIVSDSTRFRAWARLVVEDEGFAVLEARDGLAALQYAVEDAPTMILIDPDLSTGRSTGGGRSNSGDRSTSSGLSARDVQTRLMVEPQTEAIPVVVPFSAFVRCISGDPREGASVRAMRRSTATLSLRETVCNVLSSPTLDSVGPSVTR